MKAVTPEAVGIKTAKATEKADVKSGDLTAAKSEAATVKDDKKDLKKDIREAHRDGVKRHIHRA